MHYREESEGVPRVNVSVDFVDQELYKVLTRKATSISQLEEMALVGASMSMLWAPLNPRVFLFMAIRGKVSLLPILGYGLLNVLDPMAAGAMVEAILPEGKPVWLDQIRDRFLHPTSDSFVAYANVILGEDGGDDVDDTIDPTREEVIVLSSGGSDGPPEGLTSRSTRAGPTQGAVNEPVNEPADDGVDAPVDTANQLETRKKKKRENKSEEKKAEETAVKAPRKRPSTSSFLSYVVVSDTLSGLDAGVKRVERDPNDDETLTEIMKKKKVLEDNKKELDEQAAAALAAKNSKLQKETPLAPSESEIDLGVFSAKFGNLLEKIYAASGSQDTKFFLC
ncbi:hypothetical protein Hdeb2414_s0001g00021021 [Helianthus debilis subsp. tardiflorus]